jgi:hypothetical protein
MFFVGRLLSTISIISHSVTSQIGNRKQKIHHLASKQRHLSPNSIVDSFCNFSVYGEFWWDVFFICCFNWGGRLKCNRRFSAYEEFRWDVFFVCYLNSGGLLKHNKSCSFLLCRPRRQEWNNLTTFVIVVIDVRFGCNNQLSPRILKE